MKAKPYSTVFPLLFVACLGWTGLASAQAQRPNIILIIGDDQGWPDYGFMPSSRTLNTNQGPLPINQIVQTPNLDALAAQGVTFRNAHGTASVCLPSLRTVLTSAGLQPFQWTAARTALDALPQITLPGAPFFFPRPEVEHFRTVPKDLSHVGYKSWEGGKYWESTFVRGGFSHGMATGDGGFLTPVGWDFGRAGWSPATCGPTAAPNTTCPALDPLRTFLDAVEGEPFFLWFAPQIPHVPFDAPQNFRDPYEALDLTTCADLQFVCGTNCLNCASEVNYLANVTWLDAVVGELLEELDARGLRDDTLIMYFADNGWGLGFQILAGSGQGKGTLYELGFRTPLIVNWPGHVPAGVAYDDLVSTTDIPATIFDYAGVDSLPEQQGLSLRQRVEGGPPIPRSEVIGFHEGLGRFLRNATWRYLRFVSDGHEELYNVSTDPFEQTNVAAQNPTLVTTYRNMVNQWEAARMTAPSKVEIAGRVLDSSTSAPLVGSQVELGGGAFPLVSIIGDDGFFRFGPVNLGSYQAKPNLRLTNMSWLGTASPVPVTVPVGTSGSFLNIKGTQSAAVAGPFGAEIRGVLRNNGGTPLANVPVEVTGAKGCDGIRTQVSTQADGSYRAENLVFTTYSIKATPPGYQQVVVNGVVVDALEVFTQDLVAQP